jgi:AraC-like DNA-binding protein
MSDDRISQLLDRADGARSPRLRALANLLRSERDPRIASCLAEALELALAVDARPSDPVARALLLVQRDLRSAFSVERVARAVGLSRAAFARRFRAAIGTPPERWVFEQRMRRAVELLSDDRLGLAAIAHEIGYGSEFAFGRAFKRWAGMSPGKFRKQSIGRVVCLAA